MNQNKEYSFFWGMFLCLGNKFKDFATWFWKGYFLSLKVQNISLNLYFHSYHYFSNINLNGRNIKGQIYHQTLVGTLQFLIKPNKTLTNFPQIVDLRTKLSVLLQSNCLSLVELSSFQLVTVEFVFRKKSFLSQSWLILVWYNLTIHYQNRPSIIC